MRKILNLQFDLAQVWPVLASINDSFDFTALGVSNVFGAGTNTTALGAGATGTRSGNSSTLLSSSSAANLGTVLGQDLSTIAGGRATAASPTAPALGGGFSTAVTPTPIGTNSFGVLPSFFGNGFAFTSTRDVLRALIILQDDVEKMLPLVNALNGGNPTNLIGLFPTNNVSVATNNFFTTTPATRTPVPTPTGR